MSLLSATLLTQIGLACGLLAAILLALSAKVGVISEDGTVISMGLDPMEPGSENLKRVKASHWRNRYFTPLGWVLLALSFHRSSSPH